MPQRCRPTVGGKEALSAIRITGARQTGKSTLQRELFGFRMPMYVFEPHLLRIQGASHTRTWSV
jgi:hypothetical protein